MKTSTCAKCGRFGHESWICYSSAGINVGDRATRMKWARERAEERGLRSNSSSMPAGNDGSKKPRTGSGGKDQESPSALFQKRRQG